MPKSPKPKTEWVFLRGLIRSAEHWGEFPKLWSSAFPDAQVQCLDVPGNGVRYEETSPLTIAGMTDALRSQLSKSAGPRYILSLSMGAMIAIDWITRYPNDFKGAVLINTSAGGTSPFYRRLRPGVIPQMLKIATSFKIAEREERILKMTSNVAKNHPDFLKTRTEIAERYPLRLGNAVRQLVAAAVFRVPSKKPSIPCLILNSTGDQLAHPSCSVELARRWKAPLQTHPTANHELPLDDPKWIIERVREWQKVL